MDKKALLVVLGLGALAFGLGGCTDAGDPHWPVAPDITATANIALTDLVGDWDNLVVRGEMTDGDGVAMVQDGIMWTATVDGLEPGSYDYGIYFDDGNKDLAEVVGELSLTVNSNYEVGGDLEITVEPDAGTGFNLVVINHNPAYVNIKIKGAMNGWTPDITGHSADGVYWYLHFAAGAVAAGSYEWGVIEDDGSEWGIWLLPGSNLQLTVSAEGAPTGTTTFTIPSPEPVLMLTLNCDMNGYGDSYTNVQVRGEFNGWATNPTAMTDDDEDGIYTVVVEAPQNTTDLQFKFMLDGGLYENVPEACGVDDGYGGRNRSIDTGTADMTFSAPFGGCPE